MSAHQPEPYRKASLDGLLGEGDEPSAAEPQAEVEPEVEPESTDEGAEPEEVEDAQEGVLRGAIAWVTAPDVDADFAVFTVDEGGTIAIEDYTPPAALLDGENAEDFLPPDGTLDPFADAVEGRVGRPYRVRALRELGGNRFAVVAQEIETVRLFGRELIGDDMLVLAMPDGSRLAVMDGLTLDLSEPEVDEIVAENAPCLITLSQIDKGVWEVASVDHL